MFLARLQFLALTLCLLLSACAHPSRTTILSIDALDCASCGITIAEKLKKQEGVEEASFDKKKVELRVIARDDLDVMALATPFAKEDKLSLLPGAGKGNYLPPAPPPTKSDVETVVKNGASVPKLSDVVVPNKITVIEFGAVWCGPCRKLDEHMFSLLAKSTDLAYRKLDVGDWDTPLAKHYLGKVSRLPYALVFDAKGEQVDAIVGLSLKRLDAAIAKARKGS